MGNIVSDECMDFAPTSAPPRDAAAAAAAAEPDPIGFDLATGEEICARPPTLRGQTSLRKRIIEVSRREDAATALNRLHTPLVRRLGVNMRWNPMLKSKVSALDLSNPAFDILVLWSKDPIRMLDWLEEPEAVTGRTLLDAWPVVYFVCTMNGYHPELEPRVSGRNLEDRLRALGRVGEILSAHNRVPVPDCVYMKVGDPLVRFRNLRRPGGPVLTNWSDIEDVYEWMHEQGYLLAHYGFLDVRERWVRALELARSEGVELLPFDYTAPVGSARDDMAPILRELGVLAQRHGLRLVTCGDARHIGWRPLPDLPTIASGVCLDVQALNRILVAKGMRPLRVIGTSKPKGNRSCDCQDTEDIGLRAPRSTRDPATRHRLCHGCVYCFVRATQSDQPARAEKRPAAAAAAAAAEPPAQRRRIDIIDLVSSSEGYEEEFEEEEEELF